MKLRWYQEEAVQAVYNHLRERKDNPCVVMPTGAGKSPTIGRIVRDAVEEWDGRVAIVAHRKELLVQNAEKIQLFAPKLPVGIYSAGLGRRDTAQPVIVGGIQSIYKRAFEFGRFDLILVDEAHLIPTDGEGRYRQFLAEAVIANPDVRVIGFTATPYRCDSGVICAPGNILNEVCYEIGVRPLITQGFLSRPVPKSGEAEAIVDTTGVHTRGGEFVQGELEERATDLDIVRSACREIVALTQDRKSVLIFCVSVKHAEIVTAHLKAMTSDDVRYVVGETDSNERAGALYSFKQGRLKYLINVNVLTEGFDAPNIDCIVLLRPTKSPGLYSQMIGRGFRIAEGKDNCLVLDYGENILRHGPVDAIDPPKKKGGDSIAEAPAKMCPTCRYVMAVGYATCPSCGFEFPKPEFDHDRKASRASILTPPTRREWIEINEVFYEPHTKRGADDSAPKTVRVEYSVSFIEIITEWVCVEHPDDSFAKIKAQKWWRGRQPERGPKIPMPADAKEACEILRSGKMRTPGRIEVIRGSGRRGDFDKVVGYEFPLKSGEYLSDINKQTKEAVITEGELPF